MAASDSELQTISCFAKAYQKNVFLQFLKKAGSLPPTGDFGFAVTPEAVVNSDARLKKGSFMLAVSHFAVTPESQDKGMLWLNSC